MSALRFSPAGDTLLLIGSGDVGEGRVPAWLVDRPDVLAGLQGIAAKGGGAVIAAAGPAHDLVVDTSTGAVSYLDVSV